MDLTVIIPTCRRPEMLRTALASVGRQRAQDRIAAVHVSENGGDRSSESVCREFPGLPIRYTFREPALLPNPHFVALGNSVTTDYVAVLHDDDWWAPHHLAQSLADLDANPLAAARYAAFSEVAAETTPAQGDPSFACWLGAGFPATTGVWSLSAPNVSLACLAGTPLRYSCLIARRTALQSSLGVYELGNPFDTDRMLSVALSRQGSVLFDPVPAVFIRMHPQQDGRNFDAEKTIAHMTDTTRWILQTTRDAGVDLENLLATRLQSCPQSQLNAVLSLLRAPWCIQGLKLENQIPPALDQFDALHSRPVGLELTWTAFLPPLALALGRKLFRRS